MADLISDETKGKTFSDLKCIEPWLLAQLKHLKISQPTPIQYHCIPQALAGKDIIGAAKTGSGKTLAFVIPILQKLSYDPYGVYALILTPTRELAFQIGEQFHGVGAPVCLRLNVIVGGLDSVQQGRELVENPHIIVATPGRLAEFLELSPEFTLKRVKFLVLDEADRLMDGRFDDTLQVIWKHLPDKRQTLLFSATVTDRLQRMKDFAKSDVFVWKSTVKQATVEQLQEYYSLVNFAVKDASMVATLLKFKEENPKGLCLIFTNTCKFAQILGLMLNELGIESATLHSMIKQKERLAALSRFKSSRIKFLVATDLASRGLDIPMVNMVINHSIPGLPKDYIHRVGRTARAGRPGTAITFLTPNEIKILLAIEAETNRKLTELKIDEKRVLKIVREVNITRREQQIKLEQSNFDEPRVIQKRKNLILEGRDPDREEYEKEKRKKKRAKIQKKLFRDAKSQRKIFKDAKPSIS